MAAHQTSPQQTLPHSSPRPASPLQHLCNMQMHDQMTARAVAAQLRSRSAASAPQLAACSSSCLDTDASSGTTLGCFGSHRKPWWPKQGMHTMLSTAATGVRRAASLWVPKHIKSTKISMSARGEEVCPVCQMTRPVPPLHQSVWASQHDGPSGPSGRVTPGRRASQMRLTRRAPPPGTAVPQAAAPACCHQHKFIFTGVTSVTSLNQRSGFRHAVYSRSRSNALPEVLRQ